MNKHNRVFLQPLPETMIPRSWPAENGVTEQQKGGNSLGCPVLRVSKRGNRFCLPRSPANAETGTWSCSVTLFQDSQKQGSGVTRNGVSRSVYPILA
jgi:hypothetical protein